MVRHAPKFGRAGGGSAPPVSKLLVIVESRANRQRIEKLAMTFATTFPSRTWAVRRWLTSPTPGEPRCGVWFVRHGTQAVDSQRVRARRSRSTHEGGARI